MRQPSTRRTAQVLIILWSIASFGCATVFGSTTQEISVKTDPQCAKIVDLPSGVTAVSPAKLSLSKRETHRLVISKEGYRTAEIGLRREIPLHWWVMGAFTLGVSFAIDALTGAWFEIRPDYVFVPLEAD